MPPMRPTRFPFRTLPDGVRRWVLALLVAAAEVAAQWLYGADGLDFSAPPAAAVVLAAAVGLATVLRGRHPVGAFTIVLAFATAATFVGAWVGMIAMPLCLFTIGAHGTARTVAAAVAVGLAAQVAHVLIDERAVTPWTMLVGLHTGALLVVVPWVVGAYARARRERTREAELREAEADARRRHEARSALAEERAEIARELHDVITHSVAVMLMGARVARAQITTDPDAAVATLDRVEAGGRTSLAELRRSLAVLRGATDEPRLRPLPSLGDVDRLVGEFRAAGVDVELRLDGGARGVDGGVGLAAYRIVQEALTNAARHAPGAAVRVAIDRRSDGLRVEVRDDGPADDVPVLLSVRGSGHGIAGMRERAQMAGGRLEAGPVPGGGFQVVADLPLDVR